MLEVLLDVRAALNSIGAESTSESALKKLETLKKFTKLAR